MQSTPFETKGNNPRTQVDEEEDAMREDTKQTTIIETHKAARPLKFIVDHEGEGWLCDTDVDTEGDLRSQGCWRCDEMAFPAGGR